MPKIDINAAPNTSSIIGGRRATAADIGGAGRGLQRAGADVTAFGKQLNATQKRLKAQEDRQDAMDIETAFITARSDLQRQAIAAEETAEPGGAGFADARAAEVAKVNEDIAARFEGMSPENKKRVEQGAARLGGWYTNKGVEFEANARAQKIRQDAENGLSDINKSVLDGTMSIDDAEEASDALLDATGLAGNDREELGKSQREDIITARYSYLARSADTPQEIVALQADLAKNKDRFSTAGYNKMLNDLDRANDMITARNQEQDRADLATTIASGVQGGPMGEPITREEVHAMYPGRPRKAEQAWAAYNNARQQQVVMDSVATASQADVAKGTMELTRKVENAKTPEAHEEAAANLAAFRQAANRRAADVKKNPIAYVTRHFPELSTFRNEWEQARQQAQEAEQSGSRYAAEAATRAAYLQEKYVSSMDVAQARVGVINPDILTENQVEAYASVVEGALKDTEDGKGGERVLQSLRDLQEVWGGQYWGRVSDQLVREKAITGGYVALAWLDPVKDHAASLKVASALGVPPEDWKLPAGSKKEINDELALHMAEFTNSLSISAGSSGMQRNAQFTDAISALAKMYAAQGQTTKEAAQNAYDDVLGDKFEYFGPGSARVPVGDGVDFDTATSGALYAKQKLIREMDVRVPVNDLTGRGGVMDREQYISSLEGNSYWVNSGDGRGLTLVDGTGLAVGVADDPDAAELRYIPLTLSWQELETLGATRPKTTGARPATARTVGKPEPGAVRPGATDRLKGLRGGAIGAN